MKRRHDQTLSEDITQELSGIENKLLYFSILPRDILHLLVLYFPSDTSIMFTQIRNIPSFDLVLDDKNLWKILWSRDISSLRELPELCDKEYFKFFNEIYNFMKDSRHWRLVHFARRGYDILLKPLLSQDYDYVEALQYATHGGQLELVIWILENRPYKCDDRNWIMASAALYGHIEIVKLMIDLGANGYGSAMSCARAHNRYDIMKLLESHMEK